MSTAKNEDLYAALRLPIPIERVDFRIQSISKSGWATVLAYKDARVDMDRLDEVVGRGWWARKHERHGETLFCSVGVWNPIIKDFVWVQDAGSESKTEAVKGEASDSFKRACFNLGIGRELYDYPLILVELKHEEFEADGSKGKATFKLKLKEWSWAMTASQDDQGRSSIGTLIAHDEQGNERFRYPRTRAAGRTNSAPPAATTMQAPKQEAKQEESEKPWFNDFEGQRTWFEQQFIAGNNAPALIRKLREKYKVNKTIEKQITDLAVAITAGGSPREDDVPF